MREFHALIARTSFTFTDICGFIYIFLSKAVSTVQSSQDKNETRYRESKPSVCSHRKSASLSQHASVFETNRVQPEASSQHRSNLSSVRPSYLHDCGSFCRMLYVIRLTWADNPSAVSFNNKTCISPKSSNIHCAFIEIQQQKETVSMCRTYNK